MPKHRKAIGWRFHMKETQMTSPLCPLICKASTTPEQEPERDGEKRSYAARRGSLAGEGGA